MFIQDTSYVKKHHDNKSEKYRVFISRTYDKTNDSDIERAVKEGRKTFEDER